MRTLINTVIWMVLISTGIISLMCLYWLLEGHPRIGVVLLVTILAWGVADTIRWPLE